MIANSSAEVGDRRASDTPDADDAVRLVRDIWGYEVSARRLSGEKDVNFRLTDAGGRRSLIKIYSADTDPAVVEMQAAALAHVARRDPDLPIQRVIPTPTGVVCPRIRLADGTRHTLRMVSFLDGMALDGSVNTAAQRRAVGAMTARLQAALADFAHPHDDHPLVWDMKGAARLRPHLAFFAGAERDLLEGILDLFETRIVPAMADLPTQVVHNDFNGDNLLVDPDDGDRICGVIDFDDMVRAPRLFDLAVSCSYQMREAADPVDAVGDCLDGYLTAATLSPVERALLPVAILTRMAMRLIVPEWRGHRSPHNRAYVTRNSPLVRRQFARLGDLSVEAFAERLAARRPR
jgi:Ser/Thr protein kinase RdoA (MazF antagonist)